MFAQEEGPEDRLHPKSGLSLERTEGQAPRSVGGALGQRHMNVDLCSSAFPTFPCSGHLIQDGVCPGWPHSAQLVTPRGCGALLGDPCHPSLRLSSFDFSDFSDLSPPAAPRTPYLSMTHVHTAKEPKDGMCPRDGPWCPHRRRHRTDQLEGHGTGKSNSPGRLIPAQETANRQAPLPPGVGTTDPSITHSRPERDPSSGQGPGGLPLP